MSAAAIPADRRSRPRSADRGPRAPPVPPIAVGVLLLSLLAADPPAGITTSNGIRTDEAWDVINARNLVLLGRWSTDDWNLHLVNVPYSLVVAAVFSAFGVGIEQARAV